MDYDHMSEEDDEEEIKGERMLETIEEDEDGNDQTPVSERQSMYF